MTELELTKNLTLVLAYLTSWNDSKKGEPRFLRTWSGYDFDILRKLSEEDLIYGNKPGNKSFYFTEEGERKAKEWLAKISKELENEQQEAPLSEIKSLKGTLSDCNYSSIEEARDDRLSEEYGV